MTDLAANGHSSLHSAGAHAPPDARASAMQLVLTPAEASDVAPVELPIARFRRVLKGRLPWALGMTLFGMVMGGSAGWIAFKPIYASIGVVQVHPVLPRVLNNNEHNDVMPMFDAFMDSRAALITSRRVTDLAMATSEWNGFGRNASDTSPEAFAQNISVDRPHGSELIQITFTDTTPEGAQLGAQSVTDAFEKIFTEQDATSQEELFRVLNDRLATLNSQISGLRDRIVAVGGEMGPQGLQRMQDFKIDELQRMETKLHDMDIAFAMGTSPLASAPDADTDSDNPHHDPALAYLLQQQAQAQMQLDTFNIRLADSHPSVIAARSLLDAIDRRIAEKEGQAKTTTSFSVIGNANVAATNQRAQMQKLYDQIKTDVMQTGAKLVQIDKLNNELKSNEQKLDETKSRIEQLNVESMVGGRLNVVSRGEKPGKPFRDKRKQGALMLAMALGGLGFFSVLLVGMFDRRLRYASDARSAGRSLRVLGVLPELPQDLSDPVQAYAAATEVHHIRMLLQVQPAGGKPRKVFSVTGANRGAGKTSLTLAMGLSFAASGYRTLLIDGDLSGRGLTRRLGAVARRKLGRIVVQTGRATGEQVDRALEYCKANNRRLGEMLRDMRVIDSDEHQFLLQVQRDESLGLTDALRGYDTLTCVTATPFANCYVLPCCRVGAADQTCVSPNAVSKLLANVRDEYDVILIDTGPVLGNAESAVMNASADAVVLAVSRGHNRSEMERAIEVVESLHVPVLGVVFNRAGMSDVRSSVGSYYNNSSTEPGGRRRDEKLLLQALISGDPVTANDPR